MYELQIFSIISVILSFSINIVLYFMITSILLFYRKVRLLVLLFRVNETIQSQCAKYTPYAPRTFSHWRCINCRAECIAMHSRIIQEDIADSTRGRELVETKVWLARIAFLSSIDRISLIPNSMEMRQLF